MPFSPSADIDVIPFLLQFSESKIWEIRKGAVWAMAAHTANLFVVMRLMRVARDDSDTQIRELAIDILGTYLRQLADCNKTAQCGF